MDNPMQNVITFDLETIPSQLPWVEEYCKAKVKPPGTIKKQESIDAWWADEEKVSDAVSDMADKMGFDGGSNHIISFGVAIGDAPAVSFDTADIADEAKNLKIAIEYIQDSTDHFRQVFVGHNLIGFDMRVVRQRLITLGMQVPRWPFGAKPWDNNPYDTMIQWTGSPRDYVKLDMLARAFGIKGKEGMDGSMVYDAWKEGRIAEIGEYCRADVEMTREVYKVMTGIMKPPYLMEDVRTDGLPL